MVKSNCWKLGEGYGNVPKRLKRLTINVFVPGFVVMSNHVHLIVIMDNTDDGPLPQCDSPTAPMGNDNPDDGSVGLPYHDSRIRIQKVGLVKAISQQTIAVFYEAPENCYGP